MALKLVGEGRGFERYCPTFSKMLSPLVERMAEVKISRLVEMLKKDNPKVRNKAVWALGDAIFHNKDRLASLRALVEYLGDLDSGVRQNAAETLEIAAAKGVDVSIALPGLVKCLDDGDRHVRWMAAWGLWLAAEHGTDISTAVPGLARCVADEEDFRVGANASRALVKVAERGKLEAVETIPFLINELVRGEKFAAEAEKNSTWYTDVTGRADEIMKAVKARMKRAA